jgi:hypothetical protein
VGGSISSFVREPTINANGTVAFTANLTGGGQAIYTGNGGPLTTIAQTGGTYTAFQWEPVIDNTGTVAYQAVTAGGQGIFANAAGTTTTIAQTSAQITRFGQPAISSGGLVAYQTFPVAGSGAVQTVMRSDGVTIASASDPRFAGGFGSVGINATGVVAFVAGTTGGANQTVYTGSGGSPVATINGSNSVLVGMGTPAINDAGEIAVLGQAGQSHAPAMVSWTPGQSPTTVADANSYYAIGDANLNDAGLLMFYGETLNNATQGVYTGENSVLDRVIGVGTALDGSTIMGLNFEYMSLNDAGSFVIQADLADGESGIYRADLVAVPEPSVAALCCLAAAALRWQLRKRQPTSNRRPSPAYLWGYVFED